MNSNFKKSITVLSIGSTLLFSSNFVYANNLELEKSHWGYFTMEKLVKDEVLKGYEDGSLKPEKNITRAEFITIINNTFNFKDKDENIFKDVTKDNWYLNEVEKALNKDYINLITAEKFQGDKEITREEAASIIGYILDEKENVNKNNFKDDKNINKKYREYINGIASKKYINGYEDNTFKPTEKITRAEAATIIDKVIAKRYKESGTYSENIDGNIIVISKGVSLENSKISGNIYVAGELDKEDLKLINTKVDGKINILKKIKNVVNENKLAKSENTIESKTRKKSKNSSVKDTENNNINNSKDEEIKEKDLDKEIKENKFINYEKTQIIDVEGVLYLVIVLDKGSMEDYNFYIDNNEVKMTKVNSSGKIIKTELKDRKSLNLKVSKDLDEENIKIHF